jgi:flavin reductase (DIM6/NTAB) family NADH-FMN oxidoreductase RutF
MSAPAAFVTTSGGREPAMALIDQKSEIDPAHFRRVMSRFVTGVTVITAESNGETRGMTANAFMSGSLNPPLCVISVAKRARMHSHLTAAGKFAVNILANGQENYAAHYAGRPIDGFEVAFELVGGIPTLKHASAFMTADTVASHDCGDHTIFIGHIHYMSADNRPPLVFHSGHYAAIAYVGDISASLPEFW